MAFRCQEDLSGRKGQNAGEHLHGLQFQSDQIFRECVVFLINRTLKKTDSMADEYGVLI